MLITCLEVYLCVSHTLHNIQAISLPHIHVCSKLSYMHISEEYKRIIARTAKHERGRRRRIEIIMNKTWRQGKFKHCRQRMKGEKRFEDHIYHE